MTDVVNSSTGNPAVVSFGNDAGYQNGWNNGWNMGTYADIVRDINKGAGDTQVAIEKIGAANQLAIEKTAAANNLAIVTAQKDLAMQIAECCCETKALILEQGNKLEALALKIDSDNAKLQLANLNAEFLAIKYANGNPPAFGSRS